MFALNSAVRADVLTFHYDSQRTGLNPNETGLNPTTVSGLKQKWVLPTSGDVYAQPLYVSSIVIGGVRRNALYVATEMDNVDCVDADTGALLWKTTLIPAGETVVQSNCNSLPGTVGITGTPVIDRSAGKIFCVAYTIRSGHKIYRLHALNLVSGADTSGGEIAATYPGTFPAGDTSGGLVHFNAAEEKQRSALLLVGGLIYVAWGSFCDFSPFTGWIMAFDESSLSLVGRLDINPTKAGLASGSTLPDGSGGGVWSVGALSTPTNQSFIYAVTGNGPWDGKTTFSDSILKLNLRSLSLVDYFTPFDQAKDQQGDLDLGSSGILALDQNSGGTNFKLVVVAGKDKRIYVANRSNLGKLTNNNNGIYQAIPLGSGTIMPQDVFGPGAFLGNASGGAMYWAPRLGHPMEKFVFSNAKLATSSSAHSSVIFNSVGAIPAASAFIDSSGVIHGGLIWAIGLSATGGNAILYALDPGNLATRFTAMLAKPGTHFSVPTVVNSHVYVGARGAVFAFGL
jgi:outer membrane protein assembly factor BamB